MPNDSTILRWPSLGSPRPARPQVEVRRDTPYCRPWSASRELQANVNTCSGRKHISRVAVWPCHSESSLQTLHNKHHRLYCVLFISCQSLLLYIVEDFEGADLWAELVRSLFVPQGRPKVICDSMCYYVHVQLFRIRYIVALLQELQTFLSRCSWQQPSRRTQLLSPLFMIRLPSTSVWALRFQKGPDVEDKTWRI